MLSALAFSKSGFYPAFTLDTEARGLLPFYANLVQLHTFTVLRQNALTFTLPPPYKYTAIGTEPDRNEQAQSPPRARGTRNRQ